MNFKFCYWQHKDRLKQLLEESRAKDPSLPSWESLLGKGCYIDKYGFKYDKENEAVLLQYVCQQLNIFYENQPKNIEDTLWKIEELKMNFVVTVRIPEG